MAECQWMEDEGSFFKGLPPLPKGLQAPPSHGPLAPEGLGAGETCSPPGTAPDSSLQARIAWVRQQLLRLQQSDRLLLRQLGSMAQEIQDLRELQLESEEFFAAGELPGPAASSRWQGGSPGGAAVVAIAFQATL